MNTTQTQAPEIIELGKGWSFQIDYKVDIAYLRTPFMAHYATTMSISMAKQFAAAMQPAPSESEEVVDYKWYADDFAAILQKLGSYASGWHKKYLVSEIERFKNDVAMPYIHRKNLKTVARHRQPAPDAACDHLYSVNQKLGEPLNARCVRCGEPPNTSVQTAATDAEAMVMIETLHRRLTSARDLLQAKGVNVDLENTGIGLADEFLASRKPKRNIIGDHLCGSGWKDSEGDADD